MNTPLKLSPVLYHNQQKAARMFCGFYKLCPQAAIQVGQANWGNVTQFIGQRPVRIPPGRIKKRKNRRETESSSVVYWPCREGDRVKEQILAVQRMQDYIDQHLFETVTLAELARQPCFPRGTRTGSLKPVPGYPPPIISSICGFPNQRCGSGMKPRKQENVCWPARLSDIQKRPGKPGD